MAAATALSGYTSTSHLFFKRTVPFLRHHCFRRNISVTPGGLFENRRRTIAIHAHQVPTASIGVRHRRMQLLCFSTEAEAHNITAETTATVDGDDDSSIREAANILDFRVGKILKAWRHEEADSLYVEEVDVGEPEPRTICSGLVKYIPLHLLQDRNVIVLANLKPRNMRGVKSFGMLMAASDAAHENVELLVPPEGAVPGERVWFGSLDEKENLPEVASPNQVQKKKIWEQVQPHLKTDDSCVARLGVTHHMRSSAGLVICESLKNANIS